MSQGQGTPAVIIGKDVKLPLPDFFTGNFTKARSFLAQVQLYVASQPNRFPNDLVKIVFVTALLHGPAFKWMEPYAKLLSTST